MADATRRTPRVTDNPAATLEEIRAQWATVDYITFKPGVVPETGPGWQWRAELARVLAALEAALKLHQGVTDGDYPESLPVCEEDGEFSPCPTVLAITRALNGGTDA